MKKDKKVLGSLNDDLNLKGKSFLEKSNDYLANFFDKIALMNQTSEGKEEISQVVVEGSKVGPLYWSQIILSAFIATLGLLQNSVAVVIGAMLLAPLFIPLQAIAFGITEGKSRLFWRAMGVLILSSLVSIGIAIGIVWIVPLEVETSEILSRVSPNIYDLFIAAFSAVIALLALVYKKLSQSVAGVAMAAALMPPLGVIGIQIGFGNIDKALGALLLYTTNIVAIVLVGVIMFVLYGFHPHKDKSYSVVSQAFILFVVTLGLSVPLVASIQGQQREIVLYNKLNSELTEIVETTIPLGEISELVVDDVSGVVNVSLDLRLPEEVELFEADLQNFTDMISNRMEREVNLNLDIIRTASLSKQVDTEVSIANSILEFVDMNFDMLERSVLVDKQLRGDSETGFHLRILYVSDGIEDISDDEKMEFMNSIGTEFDEYQIGISWVSLNNSSESVRNEIDIQEGVRTYFENELSDDWFLDRVSVQEFSSEGIDLYDIRLWLSLPESMRDDIVDDVVIVTELERVLALYKLDIYEDQESPDFTLRYEYRFR